MKRGIVIIKWRRAQRAAEALGAPRSGCRSSCRVPQLLQSASAFASELPHKPAASAVLGKCCTRNIWPALAGSRRCACPRPQTLVGGRAPFCYSLQRIRNQVLVLLLLQLHHHLDPLVARLRRGDKRVGSASWTCCRECLKSPLRLQQQLPMRCRAAPSRGEPQGSREPLLGPGATHLELCQVLARNLHWASSLCEQQGVRDVLWRGPANKGLPLVPVAPNAPHRGSCPRRPAAETWDRRRERRGAASSSCGIRGNFRASAGLGLCFLGTVLANTGFLGRVERVVLCEQSPRVEFERVHGSEK